MIGIIKLLPTSVRIRPGRSVMTGCVSFLFVLFALAPAGAQEAAPGAPTDGSSYSTALLDLTTTEARLRETTEKVNALLGAHLSSQPTMVLVERAELDKLFSEQSLGLTGTVEPSTAARIGQLTGAKVVITGRVFAVEDQLMLVTKIIGTETGRVFGETERMLIADNPSVGAERLAEKIARTITDRGEELVASPESQDELIVKLRKAVAGKKLPSVSVRIDERVVDRTALDPAVEAELNMILQLVGFPVLDRARARTVAEVEITGEAFSQFAVRKGDLHSFRARVEVKATEHSSGKIRTIGRDMASAVDLSPDVAAKAALQKAARKIAEDIIPRLVKEE